jgi:hypothetical protein
VRALLGVELGARRERERREVLNAAYGSRLDARLVEPAPPEPDAAWA